MLVKRVEVPLPENHPHIPEWLRHVRTLQMRLDLVSHSHLVVKLLVDV